jgi:quercetin dioxygenase-like cupin family protein
MRVIRTATRLQDDANPIFDGHVATEPLVTEHDTELTRLTLVRFSQGARTKWHTHAYDQVLLATEGEGVVADEREEHVLRAGEVVVVPKGTVHWHGARPGADFAHINIATPGETIIVRPHEGT